MGNNNIGIIESLGVTGLARALLENCNLKIDVDTVTLTVDDEHKVLITKQTIENLHRRLCNVYGMNFNITVGIQNMNDDYLQQSLKEITEALDNVVHRADELKSLKTSNEAFLKYKYANKLLKKIDSAYEQARSIYCTIYADNTGVKI